MLRLAQYFACVFRSSLWWDGQGSTVYSGPLGTFLSSPLILLLSALAPNKGRIWFCNMRRCLQEKEDWREMWGKEYERSRKLGQPPRYNAPGFSQAESLRLCQHHSNHLTTTSPPPTIAGLLSLISNMSWSFTPLVMLVPLLRCSHLSLLQLANSYSSFKASSLALIPGWPALITVRSQHMHTSWLLLLSLCYDHLFMSSVSPPFDFSKTGLCSIHL